MTREAEILLDLVAIPSVSSLSNQPVIDYALQHLDGAAWNIDLHPYRDSAGIPKTNLVAVSRHPPQTDPELALVCHTDTVPFDAGWKEAVHPQVRNGKVYGRGSCDVKGYLACVLACVAQLDLKHLAGPLALVLTADEEVGCIGAKHLAGKNAVSARYTIVGEPTGLRPVNAGKGYALGEILVRGKEAHSAFPARGRSAIYDAARIVSRLERVAKRLERRRNPSFDPPFTTLNLGLIEGGTAKNIVPGECRVTVEWRPIPGQDPAWTADLIREELAGLYRQFPGLDARLDVKRIDPGFGPAATNHLSTLLEALTRRRSTTVAFGTEAGHLRSLTSEVIVFGPGDMKVAHKTGEFVRIAELNKCVLYLRAVIEKLCG